MNFRLRSLLMRLTLAYGVSMLLMIVLFTIGASLLMRSLTSAINAQMKSINGQIDPLMATLHVNAENLSQLAPVIEQRLTNQGVVIIVQSRRDHYYLEHTRSLPPLGHTNPSDGELRMGPPIFHDSGYRRYNRPHNIDVVISMILNIEPEHHLVPGGVVTIIPRPTTLGKRINFFLIEMAMLSIILIILAGIIGRALTLHSFAPLREVNKALAQLADGNFSSSPVVVREDSEIGELAINYNRAVLRMAGAIEERERNEQSMRQFIADASHELRTPLTVILGYVDALRTNQLVEQKSFERICKVIVAEGNRMRVLVENLGFLTKLDQRTITRIEIVDLAELAQEVVLAMSILQTEQRFLLQLEEGIVVTGNREELYTALRNIIDNALKYATEDPITLTTSYQNEEAIIEIADEGPGIAADELPRIFERFFRGEKRDRVSGSGLGLPIAARAVQRAHGRIDVIRRSPKGMIFRLCFPRRYFN